MKTPNKLRKLQAAAPKLSRACMGWHGLPAAIRMAAEAGIELAHGHVTRAEHLSRLADELRRASA